MGERIMSVNGLDHYSQDQLIEELLDRPEFLGLVILQRRERDTGRLVADDIVMTRTPSLTREAVEALLQAGRSLVAGTFNAAASADALPIRGDDRPLRIDAGGAIRVGQSRISLDVIVEQYERGMTPEDMVRAYDALELAEVYAVIAYYLRNRDGVRVYLKRRNEEAEALRATIEAEHPRVSRHELLARRDVGVNANAPTRQ
jgi:uncharacterized protein (DUF433 family)